LNADQDAPPPVRRTLAGTAVPLLKYPVREWPTLALVVGAMVLQIAFEVLKPWPMKFIVDHVLDGHTLPPLLRDTMERIPGEGTSEALLFWGIAATLLVFLLEWAFGLAGALAGIRFSQRMVHALAADLFTHLQRLSVGFHSRRAVGDLVRRVTNDCGCVTTIVKDGLLSVFGSAVTIAVMFWLMWQIDVTLACLALLVVPFMSLTIRACSGPLVRRSQEEQDTDGRIYTHVEETFSAIPAVQANGMEEAQERGFRERTSATLAATLRLTSVELGLKVVLGLITALGSAGVLWIGTNHVMRGQLTVGGILVFLSYLESLYTPLNAALYTPATIQGAAGSAARVLDILETRQEVADRPGAPSLTEVRGHIQFESVTFGYDPERAVLQQVSFDVEPGEVVAITGPSGAGKTTLAALILRFVDPWEGRVLVDGHDLRDVRVESVRASVGLVLQENVLFPTTIAENIAYGRPGASRRDIETAAAAADADEFIRGLPGGYDAVVGERGATLSGGERQRIAIARAVLKNSPILILDEPTSALDIGTEGRLLDALERLMRGRTTFIITHRLSTMRRAHRAFVMEHGRLTEVGAHQTFAGTGAIEPSPHDSSRQLAVPVVRS
jgi:ATP-binding cassette subfamily B protein/subfamily B ATP-binding cassette protein MsbA